MEATVNLNLVPYADIVEFLALNNRSISTDPSINYQTALNLIYSGQALEAPPSVSDLILASNLQDLTLPIYKASEILLSQDIPLLQDLSDRLLLPNIDKERILRILGFLGYLDNDTNVFDYVPREVLINILRYVDCADILLMCRLSRQFSQFCFQNLQDNLSTKYTLDLKNYTTQQLRNLCKATQVKIFTGAEKSVILTKNNLTVYGSEAQDESRKLNQIPNIRDIAYGGEYRLVLTKQGTVYSWGNNEFGQCGLDLDISEIGEPTLIPDLTDIVQVDAQWWGLSSLVVTSEGTVYAFGDGSEGQLGLGSYEEINVPTLIPNLTQVIQITTSGYHSLALLAMGQVSSFGANGYGQLGLTDTLRRNTHTLIPNLDNIGRVAVGEDHSLFLTYQGEVYACGRNDEGQSGLESRDNRTRPTLINNLVHITHISCGWHHSLVLTNTGQVYGFGVNKRGQLGLGDRKKKLIPTLINGLSNIIYVVAGPDYSIAVKDTGEIYGFGDNSHGHIGTGVENKLIPKVFARINLI